MTSEAKELRLLTELWLRGSQGYPHPIFLGLSISDTKLESPFVTRAPGTDGKDEARAESGDGESKGKIPNGNKMADKRKCQQAKGARTGCMALDFSRGQLYLRNAVRRLRHERQGGGKMRGRQRAGDDDEEEAGGCVTSKEKTMQQRGKRPSGASSNVMPVNSEGRSCQP